MTIIELREKRNKAWEAAKAFVETKRDKDGLLSAEEKAKGQKQEGKEKKGWRGKRWGNEFIRKKEG